jgi:hypothetical protein
VPESKDRKNDGKASSSTSKQSVRIGGPRWAAPGMLACWLIGLAWVSTYYVAGQEIPGMRDLGDWNIAIGMGLIALGFVFATKWE